MSAQRRHIAPEGRWAAYMIAQRRHTAQEVRWAAYMSAQRRHIARRSPLGGLHERAAPPYRAKKSAGRPT